MYKKSKKEEKPINIKNTPYLVIVESPSKCAKIEKFLGFQYRCIASQGHVRGLSKVGSMKQQYKPEFKILKEKQKQVDKMAGMIRLFAPDNIFLAMDDDREGEAIAWHICEVFNLSVDTTKRILFHEITEKAVKNAVLNPIHIRMNIVNAQKARQTIDRMIGFQISPLLTKMLVHDSGKYLSAGRCQTPTLRLIYDNDDENKKKQTNDIHYSAQGSFFTHPSTMILKLNKHLLESECKPFLEKSIQWEHILSIEKESSKSSSPPVPFNTSSLLQTASNCIRMSPKQTMELCQKMYQEGYITYMRTDSQKYAIPFLESMRTQLIDQYGEQYIGDFASLENKDNANPHEAIRVTNLNLREISGEGRIDTLYHLIWKRTFESCMSAYKYNETQISVSGPDLFQYKGAIETPIFLGWKIITTTEAEMKSTQEKQTGMLHYIKTQHKKKVAYNKIECKPGVLEKELHYTEAGLINKMESIGIGRPSTFSMLVGTIQERKYVDKTDIEGVKINCMEFVLESGKVLCSQKIQTFGAEKNKLVIQELGKQAIVKLLSQFEGLFSYGYTSRMEQELDDISENKKTYFDVCKSCDETIKQCTKPIKDKMKKTYKIKDNYELVFGKNGAYIQKLNEDGTKDTFTINTKIELDFEKLEKEAYEIEELIDYSTSSLGTYKNEELQIKKGPYGIYVEWGDKKESIKELCKKGQTIQDIRKEDIVKYLDTKKERKDIIRALHHNLFIKTGKYGPYIQYHQDKTKKPKFISLKKFPGNYEYCEIDEIMSWLKKEHHVP